MVFCVAVAGGLGLWQLNAWQQHRDDASRDLTNRPPVALATVITGDAPFPGRSVGRPVSFSGHWIDGNLYVADRELDGRRGYWVVSPLVVDGSGSAMPVVRGWSPTTSVPAPTGRATVTGWLEPSEGTGALDDDPHDDVLPEVRVASMVEHVDADLYSAFVLASDVSGQDGVRYVDQPSDGGVSVFTGARNLFYGVEWWLFGAFAVFIWVRWCRDSVQEPTDGEVLEQRAEDHVDRVS
jgi:cytochrome oxidase assembly protein ShyY1